MPVQASRRQSLMISEWFFNDIQDPIIGSYSYSQYIELVNNADTTVYLDGVRIGWGFALGYDYPSWPCSAYTQATDDPTSIWTRTVEQFPGTGHDYPVAPGRVVLVAMDAIDHTGIAQGAPDLSHADFEQEASQDVDNPAVPNMLVVGLRFPVYHGFWFNPLLNIVFLSLPVTPADLSTGRLLGADGQLSEEEMRAIVEEAARHGIRVAAHAHGAAGIKAAIRAGVTTIEHGSEIDDEAIAMMKERGTWLVPTTYLVDRINLTVLPPIVRQKAETILPVARKNLQHAIASGVKIAFGTDAGVYPHGENAGEFAVYVKLGMTPLAALQTATVRAAEALGKTDRGDIAPGRLADLVAVEGNPLEDITATQRMLGGKVVR